jgi:uncharacterized membrane protein YkoI
MTLKHLVAAVSFAALLPAVALADSGKKSPDHRPRLSEAEARTIALERVPGTVVDADLEREKGVWVYEFEIQPTATGVPKQEVLVHADDGTIVSVAAD